MLSQQQSSDSELKHQRFEVDSFPYIGAQRLHRMTVAWSCLPNQQQCRAPLFG